MSAVPERRERRQRRKRGPDPISRWLGDDQPGRPTAPGDVRYTDEFIAALDAVIGGGIEEYTGRYAVDDGSTGGFVRWSVTRDRAQRIREAQRQQRALAEVFETVQRLHEPLRNVFAELGRTINTQLHHLRLGVHDVNFARHVLGAVTGELPRLEVADDAYALDRWADDGGRVGITDY